MVSQGIITVEEKNGEEFYNVTPKGKEKEESHSIVIKWFRGLSKLYKIKLVEVVDVSATSIGEVAKNKKALADARKLGEKITKI